MAAVEEACHQSQGLISILASHLIRALLVRLLQLVNEHLRWVVQLI